MLKKISTKENESFKGFFVCKEIWHYCAHVSGSDLMYVKCNSEKVTTEKRRVLQESICTFWGLWCCLKCIFFPSVLIFLNVCLILLSMFILLLDFFLDTKAFNGTKL